VTDITLKFGPDLDAVIEQTPVMNGKPALFLVPT
jgi:hypothetical protein